MLRECFFPKALLHICFSGWGIGANSLTHLPSNITRAWGRSFSTTSKVSWFEAKKHNYVLLELGFGLCCLYLGLESTYSSSKCLLYFEEKSVILSRIWEVGGTSKHEKTGFCNNFFCSTELKVSNATTSFCNYFLSDTTEKVSNATTIRLRWTKSKSLQRPVAFLFHKQDFHKGALFFNVGFIAIQSSTF